MLKDPRNLLWILPLAALLALPFWKPFVAEFLSPERKTAGQQSASLAASDFQGSSEMTGVHFVQDKNGRREWLLRASRLYSSGADEVMQLEDVNAVFFSTAGEKDETRIRSRTAGYNPANKEISLQGAVVIENDKGYEMQTESLEYLAAQKKITSTAPVNIKGNNIAVSGNRLFYDIVSGNYRLDGDVVCRVW